MAKNICCLKKTFGRTQFFFQAKKRLSNKILVLMTCSPKICWFKKCWSKNIFVNKNFVQNFFSCDEQLKKWRCHSFRSLVRPFVMKEFFFSLRSYKDVSRSLMGVSMKYQGCFMQVSWIGRSKVVSRKFQESFKGSFEEVSRVFQWSSEDDSRKF